jgi:ribonuclease R
MHSEHDVLRAIRERVDHPATSRELLQVLKVPRDARVSFKRHLKSLVASGALIEIRGNRFGLPDRMNLVVGRVSTNPRGFAFVDPEAPLPGGATSIFIAGSNLNQAIHGDRVVVRIEHQRDPNRAEGRIVRILDRGSERIVGRYDLDEAGRGFVVPFDRRLTIDMQIPSGDSLGAADGDMVTAQVTSWPTATRPALGRVIDVLGALDAPGVDTKVIIQQYNIPDEHGEDAIAEAKHLGSALTDRDRAGRTDFRAWPIVTIDGETARDFDDAISLERLPNGNFWLGVHIADVSHYVTEGSALDRDAYERGTSVYFPERAVHMFPSDLSTGLCSLNPHVDRLVQSCLMEVDRRSGAIVRYETHDGIIHSHARMTYTEVNAILTDRDPVMMDRYRPLLPLFDRMHEVFDILHARRRRRGSIDFDLKESQIVLDDEGMVEAIVASQRNVAHRLIEEFMLVANETVAAHLERVGMPSLYRIHEPPDPMKVEVFQEFINTLGYTLPGVPGQLEPKNFQQLVERIQGKPRGKADCVPDVAHHAEGPLRGHQRRPLRSGGRGLHTLHLTHPALSGPDGAPGPSREPTTCR